MTKLSTQTSATTRGVGGAPPTLHVLMAALLIAWIWIGVVALFGGRVVSPAGVATGAAALLGFGVAMILLLRQAPLERPTRGTVLLLLVQAVAATATATDLFMLLALELPLVLPPRWARSAFVGQVLLTLSVGLVLARLGGFEASPELDVLSGTAQVAITLGSILGWQLVAFAGGMLAATEMRARRKIAALFSELELTHRLLSDRSREAERVAIARDLHDTVGHRLAALGVHLDLASRRARGEEAEALRVAKESVHELLREVREVVGTMRQEQPIDLKRALAKLLDGIRTLEVEFTLAPEAVRVSPQAEHALLRCAQEALTNVLRHAQASSVRVDLRPDRSGVALRVVDDGRGVEQWVDGNGLKGMRERLAAVGGTLAIHSSRGAGVDLTAWVPRVGDAG
ncbi:MAG: sensor histidine kinase [Candidatus Eisenbacteria bacterium]|nr:sensor histidine kinase [Candidatus Eisenbacteria bacterium]